MSINKDIRYTNPNPELFYGYVIVLVAFVIVVASFTMRYTFGIFFKPVLNELGWTRAMTAGAYTLSWFLEGSLGVVGGGITDRFGPRVVLSFCGFFLGLGCILMSQINDIWQMYVFYGVMIGIGMSGVWSPLLSTIARWFRARRGMMTGIVLAGTGVCSLIGAPLANWLISSYGWRNSYMIIGSLAFSTIIIASQFLRRDPSSMRQKPYGHNENIKSDLSTIHEGFSLRKAINTKQFWLLFAMFFCFGFCAFAFTVHIVPHATDMGISATNAPNILTIFGGLMILGRTILGSFSDRTGARRIFIIGFIIFSVTMSLLIPTKELWILYIIGALQGFAHGGMGANESLLAAEIFGLKSLGIIIGTVSLGFTFGAGIGPLVTGHIFDINGSYDMAFVLCTVLSVIGLILTLILKTNIAKSN